MGRIGSRKKQAKTKIIIVDVMNLWSQGKLAA